MAEKAQLAPKGDYKYGFHDEIENVFKSGKGLTKKLVEAMSSMKNEPEWMLKFRLKALETFEKKTDAGFRQSRNAGPLGFPEHSLLCSSVGKNGAQLG
jgi:Fe-S cluster assembly protein SufB